MSRFYRGSSMALPSGQKLQKTKILGIGCQGIMMPNTIQPGEYSMGSDDYEGMLYNTA
ncbi:MAG: hypothetical protein HYX22_00915 [Candidatus Yanofskybacteria bacterium]|nr:hypothetical protein [Candidatus Yanofskybacteria bacterium]